MKKLNNSIEVAVTPDRVLDFLTHPENLLGVWPSLVDIKGVERRPDGWHRFDWTYKMAGLRFHGSSEVVRIEKDSYLEVRNEGAIPGVFKWSLKPQGKGTRIDLAVEYEIPTPVLGAIAEALVVRMNEREQELLLHNIKASLELPPQKDTGKAVQARV